VLAVKPAEAVVVGDAPHDVLSAKAAGACNIAVTTGKFTDEELVGYRPAFIISGLAELPDLLEREFSGPPPP
jgi:phosphoglycolate phosphatase-like HAD superfamily hydrolase